MGEKGENATKGNEQSCVFHEGFYILKEEAKKNVRRVKRILPHCEVWSKIEDNNKIKVSLITSIMIYY